MSALAVIKEAAKCGVRLGLNGDSLALKASAKPPDDLLANLRKYKCQIVTILRQDAGVAPPEPDKVELEERKGMASDSAPEPYLDAWAMLQCQKPMQVSDEEWRQAVDDAGMFLDTWSSLALEFGWTAGDLFDVRRDGSPGRLVWFLVGETVRALGPAHAITESGRNFLREKDFDVGLLQGAAIK